VRRVNAEAWFTTLTQMKTKVPGLWPTKVGTTADTLDFGNGYTLGAEADSTFEYTAKMIALLCRTHIGPRWPINYESVIY
jgi:hypothetical protein